MRGNLKSILYFIGGACIVALVVSLFLSILPYILLVGVIAYLLIKLISFIKRDKETIYEKTSQNKNTYEDVNDSKYESNEDDFSGEVIDVEYEEVDKK